MWSSKILCSPLPENVLFALYAYNHDLNFWHKCSFFFKQVLSVKKFRISNGEIFLDSISQIDCGSLTQLICFIIFLKIGETLWWSTKCQIIKVSRRLCQVKTKTLVAQIILEKIFGAKYKNEVKLDRMRKVWYLLLLVFWLL